MANLPLTLRKYDAAAHTPCVKLHPALCRSLVIFVLDPAIRLLARRRTAYARGASTRRRSTALFLMPTAGAIFRNPRTLFLVYHVLFPLFRFLLLLSRPILKFFSTYSSYLARITISVALSYFRLSWDTALPTVNWCRTVTLAVYLPARFL